MAASTVSHWLTDWWQLEVIGAHKGPLLLTFIAFVVTFIATRTITRMIRAGRGPFHNLSSGGVHLHHSTPGIVLLITGAFTAIGASDGSAWVYLAAVLVGVGASLVLDEFAMIFHLKDVYWAQEGQLSVNVVTLAAACLGLAAVGVSPASSVPTVGAELWIRSAALVALCVQLVLVAIVALKGKYSTAVIGLFIAPVTWVAAIRIARPTSLWARKFYSSAKRDRATARAAEFDKRWGPVRADWDDFIGGRPTSLDSTSPDQLSSDSPTSTASTPTPTQQD